MKLNRFLKDVTIIYKNGYERMNLVICSGTNIDCITSAIAYAYFMTLKTKIKHAPVIIIEEISDPFSLITMRYLKIERGDLLYIKDLDRNVALQKTLIRNGLTDNKLHIAEADNVVSNTATSLDHLYANSIIDTDAHCITSIIVTREYTTLCGPVDPLLDLLMLLALNFMSVSVNVCLKTDTEANQLLLLMCEHNVTRIFNMLVFASSTNIAKYSRVNVSRSIKWGFAQADFLLKDYLYYFSFQKINKAVCRLMNKSKMNFYILVGDKTENIFMLYSPPKNKKKVRVFLDRNQYSILESYDIDSNTNVVFGNSVNHVPVKTWKANFEWFMGISL